MADEDPLHSLLSLSEYEARVYRALLTEAPASAYRLGKVSGVPLSRVYEIANRLVEKGAAVRGPGQPATYSPVPPETLVNAARSRAARQLDALAVELAALHTAGGTSAPEIVQGEESVLDRLGALILSARSHLMILCSSGAYVRLRGSLRSVDRHVRVQVVHSAGAADGDPVTAVADGGSAFMGRLGPKAGALVTDHPAAVQMAADYIQLREATEIAAQRAAGRFDPRSDWMQWEKDKQSRLLHVVPGGEGNAPH